MSSSAASSVAKPAPPRAACSTPCWREACTSSYRSTCSPSTVRCSCARPSWRVIAHKAARCEPPPYEGLLGEVVTDPGDVHLGGLLAAAPGALVVTGDRRLAADLEGMCELAT